MDVIDKYLSTMRSVEWNTSLGGAPELLFINNIQDRDVLTKIAKVMNYMISYLIFLMSLKIKVYRGFKKIRFRIW